LSFPDFSARLSELKAWRNCLYLQTPSSFRTFPTEALILKYPNIKGFLVNLAVRVLAPV